jgi:predicted ATP-dependent endonuclease of OLD family
LRKVSYINGTLSVLNQLSNEINPIFSEFNENWSVAFEFTSDIEKFRDIISNDIEFYLNDKSNRNIEGKGSGLQRLGYILLHSRIIKKISKKNVLLLIDEPDIYLHQGLQKKLLSHLQDLATKYQVLITTHSPVFIDSYKLQNVFLLELEISQEQTFQRVNKTFHTLSTKLVDISEYTGLKKIQEYLGIKNEDYEILDVFNIIVEGESDKKYIEETAKFFNIPLSKIVPIHGATKCEKYLEFYNSFYENIHTKPTILVLFDNDPAGRDEYKKIFKKIKNYNNINLHLEFIPTAHGYSPDKNAILQERGNHENYEIEDFVYPELIIENANSLIAKKGLNKIQFKNLESKIQAKSFKDKGILYNLDWLKNERNPERGSEINFISENAKNGIAGLYNLKGNKKISDLVVSLDIKYPSVRKFIEQILNAQFYCKQ